MSPLPPENEKRLLCLGLNYRTTPVEVRERIAFLDRDRALDGEVAEAVRLVADGTLLTAARRALEQGG